MAAGKDFVSFIQKNTIAQISHGFVARPRYTPEKEDKYTNDKQCRLCMLDQLIFFCTDSLLDYTREPEASLLGGQQS
jgi:hypothetical protein